MINAVLIDDERPSLRVLEHYLKEYNEINIIGTFTNPLEAIGQMAELRPHAVFLDINMPHLRGIDAAAEILDQIPNTDIVFITAYEQYAIEAFELHAMDYVLKPIDPARLKKTIIRLTDKRSHEPQNGSQNLIIKCLGRFQIGWENQQPIKWRTEKTKELFLFLLHNQGRKITKDELLDNLWPEHGPEKAMHQLYNGIYYIRKTLGDYGIDRSHLTIDGSYNLNLDSVAMDKSNFCNRAKDYRNASLEELAELEAIYTGDYLEGEDYPWAVLERESTAKLYFQILVRLSEGFMENKEYKKAEDLLLKGYHKNPYEDCFTELLMRLYAATGEKNKAAMHYKSYSRLLKDELNVEPSEKINKLYQAIK